MIPQSSGFCKYFFNANGKFLSLRAGGSPEEGFLAVGVLYGTPDSRDSDPRPEKKEEIIALGGMEEFYAHQAIEIGTV